MTPLACRRPQRVLAILTVALLLAAACGPGRLAPGESLSVAFALDEPPAVTTPEGTRLSGRLEARVALAARAPARDRDELRAAALEALRAAARASFGRQRGFDEAARGAFEEAARRLLSEERLELLSWEGLDLALPGSGGLRDELQPTTDLKVMLIGLDGWDWDIVEPLMAAGRMPTFQRLVDEGTRARLATIQPILSPVIWTSLATGREPADHGILDFLGLDARGETVPVTSNLRKVPAFWNVLSEARVPVGVVAWWASWPAEPVEGFVVSDRVAYQLFGVDDQELPSAGKVYPPALWPEVEPQIVRPTDVTDADVRGFVDTSAPAAGFGPQDQQLIEHFRAVLASARTYGSIGLSLHDRYQPRLGAYYFQAPDTAAHLFMRYADPPLPEVDAARQARFAPVVDRVYEYHDRLLARFLERADENTVLMIVSDHGFKTGSQRPQSDSRVEAPTAAEWHARFGVFLAAGPGIRKGHEIREASILDVFPTVLTLLGMPVADELDGRVLEEALEPEFLAAHPVRRLPSYGDLGRGEADAYAEASPEDQAILESLIAIGYVAAPTGGGGGAESPGGGAGGDGLTANAHNNAGTIALSRGELDEAVAEFRAAVERAPEFLLARTNLAQALLQSGEVAEAEAQLRQVISEAPDDKKALALLSDLLAGAGRLDEAEALARAAVTAAPRSALAWHQLGTTLEQLGRGEPAREAFEKAAGIDPEMPEPLNALGNHFEALGDFASAAHWYRKAVDADPGYAPAYNNLALQYQRLGRQDEALAVYERGREKLPGSSVLLNNLASWHHEQARRLRREAAAAAARPEEARELEQRSREAAAHAEEIYREAIAADPLDPSPLNNLGGLLGELGDGARQRELYEKAVELKPDYADALHNLADWHAKNAEFARAEDLLDRAIAAEPRHWQALRLRGAVRDRLGRSDEACTDYRASLALQPRQPLLASVVQAQCAR